MLTPETPLAAVARGLRDALDAVPGQRMTPTEKALARQPEAELSHCAYLAGQLLPRVTGQARNLAAEATRLLKQVRAIMDPQLEKLRNEFGTE